MASMLSPQVSTRDDREAPREAAAPIPQFPWPVCLVTQGPQEACFPKRWESYSPEEEGLGPQQGLDWSPFSGEPTTHQQQKASEMVVILPTCTLRSEVQDRLHPGAARGQVPGGSHVGWLILMPVTVLCLPGRNLPSPARRSKTTVIS